MAIPLEPDRAERDRLAAEVLEFVQSWFDQAPEMKAAGTDLDEETLATFTTMPEEEGQPLNAILQVLAEAGQPGIYHPSGGHMSYIPNAGLYTGALGDFLATGLNRYTGVASAAPGFSAIEHGVVDWLCSLFDMGESSGGLLVSGGSMANFTGIVTARTARLGDAFADGVLYLTRHTHHSAAKAARLAGFRNDQVVTIDVDADLRMDTEALATQVEADRAAGRRPFLSNRFRRHHRHRNRRSATRNTRGGRRQRDVDACRRRLRGILPYDRAREEDPCRNRVCRLCCA